MESSINSTARIFSLPCTLFNFWSRITYIREDHTLIINTITEQKVGRDIMDLGEVQIPHILRNERQDVSSVEGIPDNYED